MDIYSVIKNPVLRKHITYILCKLNGREPLFIPPHDKELITNKVLETIKKVSGKNMKNYLEIIKKVSRENKLIYVEQYINQMQPKKS